MSEFAQEMSGRVSRAIASLHEARSTGDEYLATVRLGELESLSRLAQDHGLDLPQVAAELAASASPSELELPEPDPCVETAVAAVHLDQQTLRSA